MFKGQLIKLRSFKESDIEVFIKLVEEEGIRETLSDTVIFPKSHTEYKEYIEKHMGIPKNNVYDFAIESLDKGEFVGSCGINQYTERERIALIGIWIANEYQGKGYGKDSLITLCKFIFDEINAHKIKLFCFESNTTAINLYKKVGFKEEGRYRKELIRNGQYYDAVHMGLFKEDLIL